MRPKTMIYMLVKGNGAPITDPSFLPTTSKEEALEMFAKFIVKDDDDDFPTGVAIMKYIPVDDVENYDFDEDDEEW